MNRLFKLLSLAVFVTLCSVSLSAQNKVTFSPDKYYRLTTQFTGEGKSLDIINDGKNDKLHMRKSDGASGQMWKITPNGNGYYRLTTAFTKEGKSLDIINDGKKNRLHMRKSDGASGQKWKITSLGNGYYRLTTMFTKDGMSLDIINDAKDDKLEMRTTGKKTGQYWKITEIKAPQSNGLKYGDVVHLQNGWNRYSGGYLDTRGYQKDFEKTGNYLCVSTAKAKNRDSGSGTWKILSASGKKEGAPVLINDEIHLLNQWSRNGGYLDTRGYQKDFEKTGNHLCVSTAKAKNRDGGSGVWRISSASGAAAGTPLTENGEIHLQNGWNRYQGGYLDTRGYQRDFEKTGNHLCVSTALKNNRDGGSGIWKVTTAKATSTSKGSTKPAVTPKAPVKPISLTRKGGPWFFGYGPKGQGFTRFNNTENLFDGKVQRKNIKGGYKWLSASQNQTNTKHTSNGDDVTYAPKSTKSVVLHPGNKVEDVAKLRFNAPSNGDFIFDISWKLADSAGKKVGIGVYSNSRAKGFRKGGKYIAVYNDTLTSSDPGKSKKKTLTISLKKGESVFFEVDRAGSGSTDHYNDSTQVSVKVK